MNVNGLYIYLILHSTVPQQQSSETCAALDTLIANRNVNETGNCTKNSICTAVNCLHNTDPTISITTEVTFLPCNDPISARTRIVLIVDELDPIVLDEISMGNRDIPFPSPLTDVFINVTFIMTNTGVNYGVS